MSPMEERVLVLALALTGAGTEDEQLLEALCGAALAGWSGRLRQAELDQRGEEALVRAAAFSAAADYLAGLGGGVASFTAGDVSVKGLGGGERALAAAALRRTAEQIMSGYARPGDIWLRGVRG